MVDSSESRREDSLILPIMLYTTREFSILVVICVLLWSLITQHLYQDPQDQVTSGDNAHQRLCCISRLILTAVTSFA